MVYASADGVGAAASDVAPDQNMFLLLGNMIDCCSPTTRSPMPFHHSLDPPGAGQPGWESGMEPTKAMLEATPYSFLLARYGPHGGQPPQRPYPAPWPPARLHSDMAGFLGKTHPRRQPLTAPRVWPRSSMLVNGLEAIPSSGRERAAPLPAVDTSTVQPCISATNWLGWPRRGVCDRGELLRFDVQSGARGIGR